MANAARRLFYAAVGLTLVFRLWLAAAMPITGDEAYFIWWGWIPDWGFYDHPPMIGWWLAALLALGDAEWWLRLPQVAQPVLLALAVHWAWPRLWPEQAERRDWAALLVLLAPVNVWNVFVTTDTALLYCAVLSGLAWLFASREQGGNVWRWYVLAGIFLAGAVLAKYFAALLGFAYLIDVLRRRNARAFAGLAITYAITVPALLLMAWWNAGNCWSNYMFNFVNRHGAHSGIGLENPLIYAATLAYVLTPPVLWLLFSRRSIRRSASADFSNVDRSLATLVAVPLLLFAALSLFRTVGLHWVLAFVPFALLLALRRLSGPAVPKLAWFFMGFAALHLAVALVVSRLPLETWRSFRIYPGLVLTFDSRILVERVVVGDSLLVSDGYSNAVTLGYNLRRYVPVLGMASSHARHDDILTDWRLQDGRDITVLRKTAPEPDEYTAWFQSVTTDSFEHRGAHYWVVRGRGFDYAAYRDSVLREVRRRYYALPPWLPQTGCYFCDRYFPEKTCIR
ncbi:MAG: glycosyltransferase family 39 protein [Rhodocyclaceae bacterium]|nr:glycosyltransferase family 39 protein [Rhodocyclaceae bacterium]